VLSDPTFPLFEVKQSELADKVNDLYRYLNPTTALETRQRKIARLTPP
jgi:hypothetical protein